MATGHRDPTSIVESTALHDFTVEKLCPYQHEHASGQRGYQTLDSFHGPVQLNLWMEQPKKCVSSNPLACIISNSLYVCLIRYGC